MDNFLSKIDKFVINTEEKLLDVVRAALKATVDEAQKPVAQGGKMPVDTGFLSWSGVATLNQIPQGEGRGRRPKAGEPSLIYNGTQGEDLNVVLARMKLGDVFYFGWTAKYAKYQEAYRGFLVSAIQNFKGHVANAVARYRQ